MTSWKVALAVFAALQAASAPAQDFGYGEELFLRNCAVCHGAEAAGNGPVGHLLARQPPDLRRLAERNDGHFPFSEVYQAIAGPRRIEAHGTREMPIWGDLFSEDAVPPAVSSAMEARQIVQARILGLTYYLQSIQQ